MCVSMCVQLHKTVKYPQHPRHTFASLCAIHVGQKDVVVICPVDPLVGIINSESCGAIDLFVNDNCLPSAIHANTSNVWRLTAVYPEHVPSQKNSTVQRTICNSRQKKILYF